MNHTRITTEALRYRLNLVRRPLLDGTAWDLEQRASQSVAAADPLVDSAIRRIATAWIRAGFRPDELCEPWSGAEVDALFQQCPELVDALDDIVRVATRSLAA
ncbi:MAG: hypothetical protein RIB98_03970 [Acidimicrobiales bacterium]